MVLDLINNLQDCCILQLLCEFLNCGFNEATAAKWISILDLEQEILPYPTL